MRITDRNQAIENFATEQSGVLIACGDLDFVPVSVRLVVHFNSPVSMAEYIRQCSLAARDGQPARCSLLYLRKDKRVQKRDLQDMRKVVMYAQSSMCRAILLARQMGERAGNCHRCDNCLKTHRPTPTFEKKPIDLDALLEAPL